MHGNTSGLFYVGVHMKTSKIEVLKSNLEDKKERIYYEGSGKGTDENYSRFRLVTGWRARGWGADLQKRTLESL